LRELRSPGSQNAWFCQMGRLLSDGDFKNFQKKVLDLGFQLDRLHSTVSTLRGETMVLSWDSHRWLNGEQNDLDNNQGSEGKYHYNNPYTVVDRPGKTMDIHFGEEGLRLDFG
jgi:hypothetical protein